MLHINTQPKLQHKTATKNKPLAQSLSTLYPVQCLTKHVPLAQDLVEKEHTHSLLLEALYVNVSNVLYSGVTNLQPGPASQRI